MELQESWNYSSAAPGTVEDPEEMEHSTMLKQKVSPVGEEAMGPSPKKRYTEDEDTVSHKSLGASVKVKEEVEDPDEMEHGTMLKQKVSPVGEEAMGPSPKKEYTEDTVSHKSLGASVKVKEEVEDPDEMEHGTMLKQKVSPFGEAMGPSPKKEYTEDTVSHKSLGASVKVKEEVEDPDEMEHGTMLKQKVSPVGEEAMGPSPKKEYTEDTVSHKSLEASVKVKEEVEDPDEMEHGTMLKQKVSPVGEEAMGPSPKKEYTEDTVSHKSLEASVKVKEEVEDPDEMEHGTMLKQKVSPVGEEAMGPSPKKEYTEDTVSHKSLGASVKVKEEVEDPDEMEHGTMLKQKVSPFGEAMGPSPKKEYTEDTVSHKSLGASVKVKEEVEDPDEMEHGTMLKQKVSPFGEAMGPSPKKEYTEDTVSHKSLEASVKVKEEVEDPDEMEHGTMLKQKVSPFGEAMGPSPKKEYTEDTVSHKSLEASVKVKEEVEDPDEMEHGTMLKQKVNPFGEAMGPSPKKEYTEDTVSHKSLGASVKVKEEDATDNQGAQVGMAEGDSKSPTVHLQKFDGKQLKSEAEDAVLPSPQGSLPGDALQGKEDDKVSAAGQSLSLDHSASTANASAARSLSASCFVVPLSTDDANHEIKYALMAEIRRYGRHYGRIFELLEEVQGPLEVQIQFVKFAIKEAARFKRYHLISYLDEMLDKLMSESTIRSNDLNLSA